MSKRYWLARVPQDTKIIEGLVGIFETRAEAQDARIKFQTETAAGSSGDIFVIIDTIHLPIQH